MKAKERHRLKKNELAAWIKDLPGKVEKHQKPISLVLLLAMVIGVAWWLWSYKSRAEAEQANAALNSALHEGDAESLAAVAIDYAGVHPVAALADYHRGLILLTQAGQKGMLPDYAGYYGAKIEEAATAFQSVLDRPYHPVTHPGARLNLARIARDEEKFDQARSLLDEVINDPRADRMIRQIANEMSLLTIEKVVFADAPPAVPPAASETIGIPGATPPEFQRMPDPLEGGLDTPPVSPSGDSPLTDPLTGGAGDTGEPD